MTVLLMKTQHINSERPPVTVVLILSTKASSLQLESRCLNFHTMMKDLQKHRVLHMKILRVPQQDVLVQAKMKNYLSYCKAKLRIVSLRLKM